jgi:hypothetical protein
MSIWKRIETIDRRIIFVALMIGVVVPMIFPVNFPVPVTPEVRKVYDMMETLKPGDVILVPCEYDPSLRVEMEPMTYAILRHAFRRGARVILVCLYPTGVSLVEQEMKRISAEAGRKYGEDYVFLGYKPYPAIVINAMGQDFRNPFPKDYYGADLDTIPMMKGVKNYGSVKFVLTVNATSGVDFWLQYGREPYQFQLGFALAAVMASDYYSQLQSGQIFGMIGGMKGAAEYEILIDARDKAVKIMNVQSVVHVLIVAFILIGNAAFLLSGGRFRMGGRA